MPKYANGDPVKQGDQICGFSATHKVVPEGLLVQVTSDSETGLNVLVSWKDEMLKLQEPAASTNLNLLSVGFPAQTGNTRSPVHASDISFEVPTDEPVAPLQAEQDEVPADVEPERISALDNLGSHLLGRKRPTTDQTAGDWPLEAIQGLTDQSALARAYAAVEKSTANPKVKAWIVQAEALLNSSPPPPDPQPVPVPVPVPPAPVSQVWADDEPTLDQGQTGHCIGFGGCQWQNTLPIDDKLSNADGDSLYYACKIVDGEPRAEDGSTVHTLASVLKIAKRLDAYAWATTVEDIAAFITSTGPVVVGTDWYQDMFTPADGFLKPTGTLAGGHCYVLIGYTPDAAGDFFTMKNSWGAGWGENGTAKILVSDFATLLAEQGEALCAVELPVAA